MSNYPDGCTQADHDAYFDFETRDDADPDTILCDCGHYEADSRTEVIGDKLICGKCQVPTPVDPMALVVLKETLKRTRSK